MNSITMVISILRSAASSKTSAMTWTADTATDAVNHLASATGPGSAGALPQVMICSGVRATGSHVWLRPRLSACGRAFLPVTGG